MLSSTQLAQHELDVAIRAINRAADVIRQSDLPGLEDVRQAEMNVQDAWVKVTVQEAEEEG